MQLKEGQVDKKQKLREQLQKSHQEDHQLQYPYITINVREKKE
jgi:hypothetical protein